MDLEMQKRLAADILDVGEDRVWIDPQRVAEVATAITRDDVRRWIDEGVIDTKSKKSPSRGRAKNKRKQKQKGRQSGPGTKKGAKGGRKSSKDEWKDKIRALREELRKFRDEGEIDSSTYRDLYRKVKGGSFRSRSHLRTYMEERGLLEEGE
ncbi:MAG: 50S ribosomal protein L19e [Candidatus Aenigmatarchaeota archaeon]